MDPRELWDAEAPTFDDEPDHGLGDETTRDAWRSMLLGVLPPAPARVADLGCGTGTLSVLLAEEGYAVDGLDVSPEMVSRARAKAEVADVAVDLRVGDANVPDLDPAAYDVVLSRHVLWAMDDPAAALRAVARAARARRRAGAGRGQLVDRRRDRLRAGGRARPGHRPRRRAAAAARGGLLGQGDHRRPLPAWSAARAAHQSAPADHAVQAESADQASFHPSISDAFRAGGPV